ncbi:MAG TPA: hypothetical protein VEM40_03655 [Nitrospirota bacterium]|nr:hypothetical protein [Nitrospirota bacterium]
MHDPENRRVELAALANEGEIARYVHDPSPKVIRALLLNRLLAEEEVLIIANRKNIPSDVLETIARDKRWAESYPVRLALARNPKSPLSISLSIARYLRLFDLEEITHCHFIPLTFRHKVEAIIMERIATMPLGNKKTLAKKAAGNILLKLLQDSDPEVVQISLNNPYLVEGLLYKVISRAETVAGTIRMIAEHPSWSCRSLIRYSLVRNAHTPLSSSVRFLQQMRIMSLRELYEDPSLPVAIKPFVHRELWDRGEDLTTKNADEKVYEIDEQDEEMIAEFEERAEKSDE